MIMRNRKEKKMLKFAKVHLFREGTVVLNKEDVRNAKDEDFKEVGIYLPYDFIQESAEELEYILNDKEDF